MASPVKNFTDPSGTPNRMGDNRALPNSVTAGATIPVMVGSGVTIALQPAIFDVRMFVVLPMPSKNLEVTNEVRSKIPPPPMGRQVLLTFPPIYREKSPDSGSTIPSNGRIFPRGSR